MLPTGVLVSSHNTFSSLYSLEELCIIIYSFATNNDFDFHLLSHVNLVHFSRTLANKEMSYEKAGLFCSLELLKIAHLHSLEAYRYALSSSSVFSLSGSLAIQQNLFSMWWFLQNKWILVLPNSPWLLTPLLFLYVYLFL